MRISDLVKKTGVSRETVHFYTREGLLPKPHKSSRNQAQYGEEHVERLKLIRELQDRFFLPLNTIGKIIQEQKKSPGRRSILHLKTEYFRPLEQFLPSEIRGEAAFLEETGVSAERLADFEHWGIIAPVLQDGRKVYSVDDVNVGKVIGDLRRLGVSVERGFRRETLKEIRDMVQVIVDKGATDYFEAALENMPAEEAVELSRPAIEMTAVFIYHLYRRMALDRMRAAEPVRREERVAQARPGAARKKRSVPAGSEG